MLQEVADGIDITLELESDILLGGWMQKKGEKGLRTWQTRFFVLVWSEINLAEREIRYFDGQDYCMRKQKGAIDLSKAISVKQLEVEGGAGLCIETPGREWNLLPVCREAAVQWYKMLTSLLARRKGLAVVASMSNLALDFGEDEKTAEEGEVCGRLAKCHSNLAARSQYASVSPASLMISPQWCRLCSRSFVRLARFPHPLSFLSGS